MQIILELINSLLNIILFYVNIFYVYNLHILCRLLILLQASRLIQQISFSPVVITGSKYFNVTRSLCLQVKLV